MKSSRRSNSSIDLNEIFESKVREFTLENKVHSAATNPNKKLSQKAFQRKKIVEKSIETENYQTKRGKSKDSFQKMETLVEVNPNSLEKIMKIQKYPSTVKHFPQLSLGERVISNSEYKGSLEKKIPLSSREEYQILGRNTAKYARVKNSLGQSEIKNVYSESNRLGKITIQKLKKNKNF